LNAFLTEVRGNATGGNVVYAERQKITPEAAQAIDLIREIEKRFGSGPGGTQLNSAACRSALAAVVDTLPHVSLSAASDPQTAMTAVLNAPGSWRNRFLYVMENVTRQRTTGFGFLVQGLRQTDVSHFRMTAALKAQDSDLPQSAAAQAQSSGAAEHRSEMTDSAIEWPHWQHGEAPATEQSGAGEIAIQGGHPRTTDDTREGLRAPAGPRSEIGAETGSPSASGRAASAPVSRRAALERSMEERGKALDQSMEERGKALRQSMEERGRAVDEFLR
jgi:hypothetical protein